VILSCKCIDNRRFLVIMFNVGVLLENKQANSTYFYVTTLGMLKEISTLDFYTRVTQSV
jgi:hypothetical protein